MKDKMKEPTPEESRPTTPESVTAPTAAHPTLLLRVEEAAAELRVGRTTMWNLVRERVIPSVKVQGGRRVRRSDLEAYVAGLGA